MSDIKRHSIIPSKKYLEKITTLKAQKKYYDILLYDPIFR